MPVRILAVPVKPLARAKTRLSPILSPMERAALALAMLEDVLDAASGVPGWEMWVVSPDEAALEIAARRRVRAITEIKPPLAAAVRQVEKDAGEREADALAILLADTAMVTSEALIVALHTLGPVVLAPASRGGGTNLLLRRPPKSIASRFGPESFQRHLHAAETRGLPSAIVERPELAYDLDTPDDVRTLLQSGKQGRTRDVCGEMDLSTRLRVGA